MMAGGRAMVGRRGGGGAVIHASLITADGAARPVTPPISTPSAQAESATVARRAASGAVWSLLAFGAGKGLGFLTNIVLARLLAPADFGLVSFAMILIGAFLLLQDLGVGTALVYMKADIRRVGGTALTINLLAAAILVLLAAIIGGVVAYASDADTTAAILVALALGLLATAAGSVQTATLTQELAFRRKFLPDVVPLVLSGVVSIGLAALGVGVWSLVWGYLAKAASATLLLWWLAPVRPRPQFDPAIARELLRYGRHVSLSSVIGFALLNVDYFIIGHRLGATALGFYTLAFTIGILPSSLIGQQIATASFPAYTRLRHNAAALSALFTDTFAITSALAIALGAAIWVGMPSLIGPLLGAKWLAIVGPLRLLAIFGVLRAIEYTFAPLYRAIGRPEIMWLASGLRLLILAPLLLWGVGAGIERVAQIQVLVGVAFIPLNGIVVGRLLDFERGLAWRLLGPQLVGLAVLVAIIAAGLAWPPTRALAAGPAGATALTLLAVGGQCAALAGFYPAIVVRARGYLAGLRAAPRQAI